MAKDGHSSSVHPDLENKPGKTNWVEKAGGLPSFIERIAKHLVSDEGMSEGHAIAAAVNTCRRWAKGGGNVTAETQAKAQKAIAEWDAKRGKAKASKGLSNNTATTGNSSDAQYSQIQRDVETSPTAGLTDAEKTAREELRAAVQAEQVRRATAKQIETQRTAIERTQAALDRAKTGGKVAERMAARLADQQAKLAEMESSIELAHPYNANQPRYPKGSPKGGQWIDTTPGDGGKLKPQNGGATPSLDHLPTVKPAAAKKTTIKKNSVEYWERALEKTQEAKAKAKPGGAIYKKMEAREADQKLMIAHMKASHLETFDEAKWAKVKENGTLHPSLKDDKLSPEDEAKADDLVAKIMGSAGPTGGLGSYEKISSAMDAAGEVAKVTDKDHYVYKHNDEWLATSTAPSVPGMKYMLIDKAGDPNPKTVPAAGAAKNAPISEHPDYGMMYEKAADNAKMWAQNHYIYKDDAGELAIAKGKAPAGKDSIKVEPSGVAVDRPATVDGVKVVDSVAGSDDVNEIMDDAIAKAKDLGVTHFVWKDPQSGKFKNSTAKPFGQEKYAKINPDGSIEQSEAMKPKPATAVYPSGPEAVQAAKSLAAANGKNHYAWSEDGGPYQVSENPPPKDKLGKTVHGYMEIKPDGSDPEFKLPHDPYPGDGGAKTESNKVGFDEVTYPGQYEAVNYAQTQSLAKGVKYYSWKNYDTGDWHASTDAPTEAGQSYKIWNPNGNVEYTHVGAETTQHGYGDGGVDSVESKHFTSYGEAKEHALKAAKDSGKPAYISQPDPWNANNVIVSSSPPDKSSVLESQEKFQAVHPNGQINTIYFENDDDDGDDSVELDSPVAPKSIKWEEPPANVLAAMNPAEVDKYKAAIEDAKLHVTNMKKDIYVYKLPGEADFMTGASEPPPGTKYTKVWKTGAITTSGTPAYSNAPHPSPSVSHASPTTKVATTADKPLAGENLEAKGPATEFDWPNAADRKTGLDALSDKVKPFVEGTPEGDALKARFLPNEMEVAAHYKASKVKMSGDAKKIARKYTGQYYSTLNGALRGKQSMSDSVAKDIALMDEAIGAYKTAEPMMVHRGVHSFPEGDMVGKMVQDPGYMSTAVGQPFGSATQLHIFVPAGTHGVSVDGLFHDGGMHSGEKEFILPRGTMLMITKDETESSGYGTSKRHITATVVPIPKDHKPINGPAPAAPAGFSPKAYSAEGLEFLRVNGRAKWAKRYSNGAELALARPAWYNSPIGKMGRQPGGSR